MPDPTALPVTEQVHTDTPTTQQQASVTQQEPPSPEPSDEPTAEQIAQWQQQAGQAAELQRQLQQTAESARYHQSQASRFQQALQQVAGGQPQQPPASPTAAIEKLLFDEGLNETAARGIAKAIQAGYAPLQQQLQQSQAALQGGFQVDNMLGAAMQSNQQLFANPAVQAEVRNQAMQIVMSGQQVEPSFLVDLGYIAAGRLAAQQQQQGGAPNVVQMPQPHPQAQPFARGMYGIQPNFQQPLPGGQQRQLSPAAAALQAEAEARYK